MTNIDDRQYDAERTAKRAVIAARLASERAAKAAALAEHRAAREVEWEAESNRRLDARFRVASARAGKLICHHDAIYDTCPTCQAESQRERDDEAAASL